MATPDLTAGQVMDASAALLNDVAKSTYTYAVQIPFLNISLRELQELYEQNQIPATDVLSAILTVPSGTSEISFTSSPALPSNLIEPQLLWEAPTGTTPFTPMTRINWIPQTQIGVEISQFVVYVWGDQKIKLLPANADIDIKIQYTKNLFSTITADTDQIGVINAMSFLQFRTAALVAEHIEENKARADDLNANASLSLDRAIGIGTKGRQAIQIRRRPFRAGYKSRAGY